MGEMYVFSASALLALSTVFAHYLSKGINPLILVFYSFLITFVLFNFLGASRRDKFIILIKNNWQWVLFVNISTTVDWLLIFIALKYVSAALINCFVFGVAPIATLILGIKKYYSKWLFAKDAMICFLITTLLVTLSIIYYHNNFGIISNAYVIFGIILSCISGLATGATVYGCKMLHERGFSAKSVMKSRFIVITIVALILLLHSEITIMIPMSNILNVVLLSFLFIIIPIFLLQKGIEKTTPIVTSIIASLIPVLTYLFQFFEPEFKFDWSESFIILLLSGVVCTITFMKQKTKV